MRGKFFVIDGVDGAGKATQIRLLKEKLTKDGHKVEIMDFPQYDTFLGSLVGKYLRGEFGSLKEVNKETAILLYAIDRYQVKDKIEKSLKEGKIVISNRYTTANIGYQGAKFSPEEREKTIAWIEMVESRLPQPDAVIFPLVPRKIARTLIGSKDIRTYLSDGKEDIHETNDDYQLEVENLYRTLIQEKDGWFGVECVKDGKLRSKEEIFEKVWEIVDRYLKKE